MDQRKLEVMLELDRRGELPARQAEILGELKSRGAIPQDVIDSYQLSLSDAAAQGVAADGGFPDDPAGQRGSDYPRPYDLAGILGLSDASNQEPGVQGPAPGGQGETAIEPGILDFLGAYLGDAAPTDVLMAAPDAIATLMGAGGSVLDPEFRQNRQDLVESTAIMSAIPGLGVAGGKGAVAGGKAIARGAPAAGRVAKEFAPDVAGGLLGGVAGGPLGGVFGGVAGVPFGGLAGAKYGARKLADRFGRSTGLFARASKAIKGGKMGSKAIAKTDIPAKLGSNAERHARLVRELLGGGG